MAQKGVIFGIGGSSTRYEISGASQRNSRWKAAMKVNLLWLYLMLQALLMSGCLAGPDHQSSVGGWKELKRRPYRGSALSSHTKKISPIERLRSSRTTYPYDGYKNRRKPNIILFVTDDQDVELGTCNNAV